MAIEYDKRLLLRFLLLLLDAVSHLYIGSRPLLPPPEDALIEDRIAFEQSLKEVYAARHKAGNSLSAACVTFSLILRQAEKTIDQLAKD